MNDELAKAIDTRTITAALTSGTITARQLAEAPIVFTCSCNMQQSPTNYRCSRCGEVL